LLRLGRLLLLVLLAHGLCAVAFAQGSPAASHSRASLLMKYGRFVEAAALLSPLVTTNPKDADVAYRLGVCLWRTGDLSGATEAFRRAQALRPREAVYAASLARVYAEGANFERASYWYRKLLLLRPGNMRLTMEAAQYSMQQDRPLEAELLLKRALAKTPTDAEGWMLLGQCYLQLQLKAEAAQCFEKAALKKPPQRAQLQQIIGLYMDGGQPERALPYLQMAQRLAPDDAALQAQMGAYYESAGDARAALAAYRAAAKLAPRRVEYRLALARLLAETDAPAALKEYDAAFAMQQPTAELLLAASAVAKKAGDNAAALGYLTRLVALKPSEIEPRELLVQEALSGGDNLLALRQWRELQRAGEPGCAVSEAEEALKLGAREWALGRLREVAPVAREDPAVAARLASLFAKLEDRPQAVALATQALQETRGNREVALQAAEVLLTAGEPARAETVFRQLYQEQPADIRVVRGLAASLLRQNQPQPAYDLLQPILRQGPHDFELVRTFVEAAEALGELPRAATLLTELVQLEPDNEPMLEGLVYLYRRREGPLLAARRLAGLAQRQPKNELFALTAARELVAAGQWQDAAALYERLTKGSRYTAAARAGLSEVLLAQGKHAELLATLARLTGPQAIGNEAYKLLTDIRAQMALQGGKLDNLPEVAAAATAVCLSPVQSQEYYLAMADLYLAAKQPETGIGYLQSQATAREQKAAATVGLARLLRKLGRAGEALVWLDQSPTETSEATLERAQCLLAQGQPLDASLTAERVLSDETATGRAEAHMVAAEGCIKGYRPEEALWHYCQALRSGSIPAETVASIVTLCTRQPLDERAVTNAVQQLYAQGFTNPALEIADALSQQPGYGALKRWAMEMVR
jgi:tetratricopeptide (TPR) repeat protein